MISDEHYPHNGADTVVVINTAAALGAAGADVTLVTPKLWWRHKSDEAVMTHYGVAPTFTLTRLKSWLPTGRTLRLEKLGHGLLAPLFARRSRFDMIHSRDLIPLLLAQGIGLPWSFETYRRHAEEKPLLPRLTRRLGLERSIGAVAHSPASAEDLVRVGFDEAQVLVARPGIDPDRFTPALTRSAARELIGMETDRPLVVYVGNVGPAKGTDEMTDLAARLPQVDFLLVGGTPEAVAALNDELRKNRIRNVILAGYRPPGELSRYLFAADVLFMPAIFRNAHAESFAGLLPIQPLPGTPLKLYSYLAAGRPIVSADQTITRDLLTHEKDALLVPPRDGEKTAEAINRILDNEVLAKRLSKTARKEAADYTWEKRGIRMLEFFERRLSAR